MSKHVTTRKGFGNLGRLLALCAVAALVGRAEAADDTAIFSASVPPNVVLMVDNSGSMNEIMWHPNYNSAQSACELFPYVSAPAASAPYATPIVTGTPNGSSSIGSSSNTTPYTCDSGSRHCRFQLDEGINPSGSSGDFVSTGSVACGRTATCGAGLSSTSCRKGYITRTFCGNTRKLYIDAETACKDNETWYSEEYLEWYFSDAADAFFGGLAEPNTSTNGTLVDADANGTHYIDGTTFPLFKRSRITAAKEIARDVIFQINTNCGPGTGNIATLGCPFGTKDSVRFGIAQFDGNAHGGFVKAPVDKYSSNATSLDAAVDALDAQTSTPLAETLFKLYTYFMSRTAADRPLGQDGATRFPKYQYDTNNGANTSSPPADPLDCNPTTSGSQPCTCQKNFVILLTDGEPTNDNFASDGGGSSSTRTASFGSFSSLIGDYAPRPAGGDETEVGYSGSGNGSRYLDDVALFMHTNDFRLDLNGTQAMDVYTVGLATNANANDLLQRTAANGNGLFFTATQSQALTDALVQSINDIIQKSQSFTAATVPASRTADGGNFYVTEFVPSNTDPFWEGHLKNFQITADGRILDSTGACAVADAACESGVIRSTAVPFWDAADQIPPVVSRTLVTAVNGAPELFNITPAPGTDAADLGVTWPTAAYPNSLAGTAAGGATNATKAEYLADEIVMYVRGCTFGTGVSNACVPRAARLGDIFHSNPVVVGRPSAYLDEDSYKQFAANWSTRDRIIYAGANDGFLHGFHAGDWNAGATPPAYSRGDGTEIIGFMPWSARQRIKNLPIDTNGRDYYFVDGSPKVADVWFAPADDSVAKAADGSEWHTILVGGLRQGGRNYYALDVTNPANAGTGMYLWEFPRENAAAAIKDYVGETWSEPVITKVKVEASAGDDNNGEGYERWVVIVGGGYDPKGDPNHPIAGTYDATATATTSKAGRAIFMLDARTGQVIAEKKFIYNATDEQAQMKFAIASTAGVFDVDSDGYADVVFVGDLGGNMWKWTIHDVGADTNSDGKIDNWAFRKFFDAPEFPNSVTPTRWKSFFFPPNATLVDGTMWLGWGSGERADLRWLGIPDATDPSHLDNNRFYAMTDLDPLDTQLPVPAPLTESNLLDLSGDETCASIVSPLRGYFFKVGQVDFNGDGTDDEGEKFVTNTALFAGYVFASTFIPSASSTDPCVSGGTAVLYVFKIDCGEGFFDDSSSNPTRALDLGTGMPTDPRISISGGDVGGGGPPPPCGGTHANKVFVITSDNKIQNECTPEMDGGGTRTHYWRQR